MWETWRTGSIARFVCSEQPLPRVRAESIPVVSGLHSQGGRPGKSTHQRAEVRERHGHHHRDADDPLEHGRGDGRLCPAAPRSTMIGARDRPEREHAKCRQEQPDAVMARRVRQGAQEIKKAQCPAIRSPIGSLRQRPERLSTIRSPR